MKQTVIFLSAMMILAGLNSCNQGISVVRASGLAYEVCVVMEQSLWDNELGETVMEELTSPVPYLLQDEPSMRVTRVTPDQFDGLLKYMRNILIINVDNNKYTKVSMHSEHDKWADGQTVVYINSPSELMLDGYLTENERMLVNYFNNEEMKRASAYLLRSYSPLVMDKVKDKFGISLNAPNDITLFKEGDDCLWFSNDAALGRCDLLVYSFPFTDKNTFTLDYLVAKRDSVAKKLVPGSFAGSYMATEKRVVDFFPSTLNNKYCGILRGWWKMEGGDMMGGPFVSYARVDEANKRVIVTEGFVYEPNKEKRKYIRRLEAALRTALLPDELSAASASPTAVIPNLKE